MQEFDKDENTKENLIKDILEKNENGLKTGKVTRVVGESGSEEFRFSSDGAEFIFDKDVPESSETAEESAPVSVPGG